LVRLSMAARDALWEWGSIVYVAIEVCLSLSAVLATLTIYGHLAG
jgi:hypothetical protein